MVQVLILFDSPFEFRGPVSGSSDTIDLFPLTDNWRLIHSVQGQLASTGSHVNLLNASQLIAEEVADLRKKLIGWSANLGERCLGAQSLKEWFLLKDEKVTTWWFSLLSEKNPLKTDTFLRLAQVHAAKKQIHAKPYHFCYVALGTRNLTRIITSICRDATIPIKQLHQPAPRKSFKAWLAAGLETHMLGDSLLRSLLWAAQFALKSFKARQTMGRLVVDRQKPTSLLFVSYFPAFDREEAKGGIFKNRYALPLQDFLTEKRAAANWLFVTVPLEGFRYQDALKYGKSFAEHGEAVFFLEEFLSLGDLGRCLAVWTMQVFKCVFLSAQMPREFLTKGLTSVECERLLKKLWYLSFVGYPGISGIIFFQAYKNAFKYFARNALCIYYLEMQAWEKALNAAHRDHPEIKTIGFQHSAFSMNHFSYFYTPTEIQRKGNRLDLPLPDILGCNGDIPYTTFIEQGYSNVRRLEAIRHLYLETILNGQKPVKQQPPVVLLVGGYDKEEAKSLFLLLNEALPDPEGFEVWIKYHPSSPLGAILKEVGMEGKQFKYQFRKEAMNELLPLVTTVIAGASSVAIDALAFGCHVILPTFTNSLFMNPLGYVPECYEKVYGPSELAQAVQRTLVQDINEDIFKKGLNTVQSFWDIDDSLPHWNRVLYGTPTS